MEVGLNHFDVERFISSNQLPLIETDNLYAIVKAVERVALRPHCLAIVAPQGYGVSRSLTYLEEKLRPDALRFEVKRNQKFKSFVQEMLFQSGHESPGYLYHNCALPDLMHACKYLFESSYSKKLIMMDNVNYWKEQSIGSFTQFMENNTSKTGAVFAITPRFLKKAESKALHDSDWQKFMDLIDEWLILEKPANEDMNAICFESGIIHEGTINEIVSSCSNLRQLNTMLGRLRRHVKEKVNAN